MERNETRNLFRKVSHVDKMKGAAAHKKNTFILLLDLQRPPGSQRTLGNINVAGKIGQKMTCCSSLIDCKLTIKLLACLLLF